VERIFKKIMGSRKGISVMQDAILFCLMVSISGAILMPAFTSDISKETYVEKENEEKAYEILHQLMVCKVNKFSHLNGERVISSLGIDTQQEGLLTSIIDNLLMREQLHRTYADLCVECVACQFKILGYRVNILTQNFTEMLRLELKKFLDERCGTHYKYNFTIVWNPIVGFDFGGDLSVGDPIPQGDVYVAAAYVTMPPSLFTTGIGFPLQSIKDYVYNEEIKNGFYEAKNGMISEEDFKEILRNFLIDLINKVIWEGFDGQENSLVDIVIDYLFEKLKNSIQDVFGEALNMVNDAISKTGNDFSSLTDKLIKESFATLISSISLSDTFTEIIEKTKEYIKEKVKDFIKNVIEEKIQAMVSSIVKNIHEITDIGTEILNWLFQQINFCRAKMVLAIWEV